MSPQASSRGSSSAPLDDFWGDTSKEVSGSGYTCGGPTLGSKAVSYDTGFRSTRAEQHRARADDARRLIQNGWRYRGRVRARTFLQALKHEFLAGVYGAMPTGGGMVVDAADVWWSTSTISITLYSIDEGVDDAG